MEIVNSQERLWDKRDLSGAHEPHWFRQFAAAANAEKPVQATALPDNANAIAFHTSQGFEVARIEHYGPGEDRVFFSLRLTDS